MFPLKEITETLKSVVSLPSAAKISLGKSSICLETIGSLFSCWETYCDKGSTHHWNATLPNKPGQTYTIGSVYPGERNLEEFLFFPHDLVAPVHCHIFVDDKDQYWIKPEAPDAKVFLNRVPISGDRLLNIGDIISLGIPQKFGCYNCLKDNCPVFMVAEEEECRRGEVNDTDEGDCEKLSGAVMKMGSDLKGPWFTWGADSPQMVWKRGRVKVFVDPNSHPIALRVGHHLLPSIHLKELCSSSYAKNYSCISVNVEKEKTLTKKFESGNVDETEEMPVSHFTPRDNSLILSKIFQHLSISDLKICRLVRKPWESEARLLLQKKGCIRFNLDSDYEHPKNSMKIFRFLSEMKGLILSNLQLNINILYKYKDAELHRLPVLPKETLQKMSSDIEKLVKSDHNFKSLTLHQADENDENSSKIFQLILISLDQNLEELVLNRCVSGIFSFSPEAMPLLKFKSLKKFIHKTYSFESRGIEKWVTYIVPLLAEKLESFTSTDEIVGCYLRQFSETKMLKLKEFRCENQLKMEDVQLLSQLRLPLKKITIDYLRISKSEASAVNKMLETYAPNLEVLKVFLLGNTYNSEETVTLIFPCFPNMRELFFRLSDNVRIRWKNEAILCYAVYFPVLRNLTILPESEYSFKEGYHNNLGIWVEPESVFKSFFPSESGEVYETVFFLKIPQFLYPPYIEKLRRIAKMFPNVEIEMLNRYKDVLVL